MQVHHCANDELPLDDSIEHTVGEPVYAAPPVLPCERRPCAGVCIDHLEGVAELVRKPNAETDFLPFVASDYVVQV